MRKFLLAALAGLLFFSAAASAQDLLRHNYKKNGYVYTGTERIRVTSGAGSTPLQVKLSRVSFPDGAAIYILHIDVESATAWKIPKNAPLTIRTTTGKTVLSKNSFEGANPIAPEGIRTNGSKIYWNCGEYYYEEDDIKKIAVGVSGIELQRRWSSDGVIKETYKNDEFGKAIFRQFEAIENAPAPKYEISGLLNALQDQDGNRIVESKTLSVNGQLSLSLSYIYYASDNSESYDLNLFLPGKEIPLDGQVTLTTSSGQTIRLKQEKVTEKGRVTCYPDIEQVKRMSSGVVQLTIQTTTGTVTLNVRDGSFSTAVDKLYNAIQTVAIL